MKLSHALAVTLLAEAASALPHYTFPALTGTSDWQYVRQTLNYQSNAGLSDVTSSQIRCYENANAGARKAGTMTVAAGSSVSFKASPNIFHPGPLQFYMAKVPAGVEPSTWSGEGNVWFKIYAEQAKSSGGQLSWGSLNAATASVKLPSSLPAGDYLLRVEHIALHQASQTNGAQFYISCAQVKVTGGGNGSPGPLVAFPGAYKATDPGIKVNIYSGATSYTPPGPAVWSG
jgi:hypothetical protein